jgi:drug/metabolite transporter (DMT)-like permease
MILAVFLLGERVTRARWLVVCLAFIGLLLITRPGSAGFQAAALIALLAAILMGIEAIFIKMLSDADGALRILSINNGIGAIVSVSVGLTVWVDPTPTQWILLALLGMVMLSGQFCFIHAMKRSDASFIIPLFYMTPVFAAVYDFALFGESVAALSVIGIALIISSAVILARKGN